MKNENTDLNNYYYNEENLNEISENTVFFEQLVPNTSNISSTPGTMGIGNGCVFLTIFLIIELIALLILNIIRKDRKKVIFGIVSCILVYFSRIGVDAYISKSIIRYVIMISIIGIISIIYCFPKRTKQKGGNQT